MLTLGRPGPLAEFGSPLLGPVAVAPVGLAIGAARLALPGADAAGLARGVVPSGARLLVLPGIHLPFSPGGVLAVPGARSLSAVSVRSLTLSIALVGLLEPVPLALLLAVLTLLLSVLALLLSVLALLLAVLALLLAVLALLPLSLTLLPLWLTPLPLLLTPLPLFLALLATVLTLLLAMLTLLLSMLTLLLAMLTLPCLLGTLLALLLAVLWPLLLPPSISSPSDPGGLLVLVGPGPCALLGFPTGPLALLGPGFAERLRRAGVAGRLAVARFPAVLEPRLVDRRPVGLAGSLARRLSRSSLSRSSSLALADLALFTASRLLVSALLAGELPLAGRAFPGAPTGERALVVGL